MAESLSSWYLRARKSLGDGLVHRADIELTQGIKKSLSILKHLSQYSSIFRDLFGPSIAILFKAVK